MSEMEDQEVIDQPSPVASLERAKGKEISCTKQHCVMAFHSLKTYLASSSSSPSHHPPHLHRHEESSFHQHLPPASFHAPSSSKLTTTKGKAPFAAQTNIQLPAELANLEDGASTLFPLFVTYNERKPKVVDYGLKRKEIWAEENELRGCLGTFEPLPLRDGIVEYGRRAGREDPRFKPIRLAQLEEHPDHWSVTVSLLHSFEPVMGKNPQAGQTLSDVFFSYLDWTVGVHGLQIRLMDKKGHLYSGTFLPDVAVEQRWNKHDTLTHLLLKAGYSNHGGNIISRLQITRYQSSMCSCTYREYLATASEFT